MAPRLFNSFYSLNRKNGLRSPIWEPVNNCENAKPRPSRRTVGDDKVSGRQHWCEKARLDPNLSVSLSGCRFDIG